MVTGVLSALPIVQAGNACCCLWVVSGALVATYVLQQNQTTPITAGDGALVGFLAGIAGALIMFALSIPITLFLAPFERSMVQRVLDAGGSMPPELRQILENYGEGRRNMGFLGIIALRTVFLLVFLVVGSLFSTLGGLLGAVLFVRRVTPPPLSPGTPQV